VNSVNRCAPFTSPTLPGAVDVVVVVVHMIKLQDHFPPTRRTEPNGVEQNPHSL